MSQQINLYQPLFRKQKKKFSALAMAQATGALVAGIVLMYGYSQWQVQSQRAELHAAEARLASVSKKLDDVARQFGRTTPGRSVEQELAELEQRLAERRQVREILGRGVFGNTQGFADYLAAFARQHVPGVWLTGFDIVGRAEQMTLAGRSVEPELVPRYLQRLSGEPRLTGTEFRVFQMNRPADRATAPYVEFLVKTHATGGTRTP